MTKKNMSGYSPHLETHVDAFLLDVKHELFGEHVSSEQWSAPVQELDDLLRRDPIVRMYVLEMFQQVPQQNRVVSSIAELLRALQLISTRAPEYNADPKRANFFPVSTLFAYMMMTTAGQAIFRVDSFNDRIKRILKSWCLYLDSPASREVLHTSENGWLCTSSYARHNLDEYLIPDRSAPHWGFASFNAFFHRQVKPEFRPIADPANAKVIVSPNDGTLYKIGREIKSIDQFWIKSQRYSLLHMLAGDALAERFQDGTIFQSFLDGKNYHRFHAPITGTVRKITTIEGLMFSNAEAVGEDLTAGTYSQAYMSCVNTRSLVFVESDDPAIGMVCLVAVGISEVSSISISVQVGHQVVKGDELGYFSYGGSSVCLIFQAGTVRDFTIDTSNVGTKVGTRGAALKAGQSIAIAY